MNVMAQTHAASEPPLGREMVWIPGGQFLMGSDNHYPEEAPAHRVKVDGFWIDRYAVTNREFEKFVKETGHVTLAERPANPEDYPDALPEMLAPSSTVFRKPSAPVDMRNHYNWWTYVPGANWRHPRGPASSIAKLKDHPVVHVAFDDVEAYARWVGMQLPTAAKDTALGSTPARAKASFATTAPNSLGSMSLSEPPKPPTAERTALSATTSRFAIHTPPRKWTTPALLNPPG